MCVARTAAKHHVFAVEPGSGGSSDEELRAVGVAAGVRLRTKHETQHNGRDETRATRNTRAE